jgi:uncharacterized RDD family membrane protein YckC
MPAAEKVSLDATHTVLTPEYVEFNFVLAGLMSRFLALLLDTFISIVVSYIGMLLVMLLGAAMGFVAGGAEGAGGFGMAGQFIIWFLIDWGYMVVLETAWSGQTIGKRIMGLRVIQETGVRIGVTQSLLRNLVRPVDRLPFFYFVGGVFALFSESQQRLGDLLAGTIVVRERRLKIPSQLERPDGDVSLLADLDFRARVAKLTEEERALFFSASLRREEMGIEARLNLFAALCKRLEEQLGFTKPPHLSDEKLVLLVTAAALASQPKAKLKKAQKYVVA